MIMKGRAHRRLPLAGVLSLTMIAAATLPAWATQDPVPPPPPPAPAAVVPQQPPPSPPAPPPPPPSRARVPPQRHAVAPTPPRVTSVSPVRSGRYVVALNPERLPADGRDLVESFAADLRAIQHEADRKTAERREALTKALQDLQEQYTKAGRLDEAVAVRDYLRGGGVGREYDVQLSERKAPPAIKR